MAALNGNNAYLSWNAVNISGFWTKEVTPEESVEVEDTTAGAGRTHIQRAPKLLDNKMDFVVIYDDSALATYVSQLKAGTKAILMWGPESNVAGKPKFAGSMILQRVKMNQGITKDMQVFELSFVQADTPTHTITGGSTF